MGKLLIVESPAKAKTIQKYLGADFTVLASMGHIRDLPKSTLGVDVENGFEPQYVDMPAKKDTISKLRSAAKESDFVYLATDPDREGEAISWHLATALKLDATLQNRVTFNEITKSGVKAGMAAPRQIDVNLVDAQQTRRILDRLVGYKLSPFLWQKVKKGLSAGRVQSVAVWLIVEREREIRAFEPVEYWTVEADLQKDGEVFRARFYGNADGELKLNNEAAAQQVIDAVSNAEFTVGSIKRAARQKNPMPPFTTSTLQQDAARRLGFRSSRTMQVAQTLYEGVNVEGVGEVGLITYMRTDSLRISAEAAAEAEQYIRQTYGEGYLPEKRRVYKSKKDAQDAHEAIRPSTPSLTPERVRSSLTSEQYRLYKLIWERFMASQMASCVQDTVTADIVSAGYVFKASGLKVKFDGFCVLYDYSNDEAEQTVDVLASLKVGDHTALEEVSSAQHFTQPPARYNEATLIKAMEEKGIGRPSTYAPIISTIISREYVERDNKNLRPTPLGEAVTGLLEEQFSDIVDVTFTAQMEEKLDDIDNGTQQMKPVLEEFYTDFAANLERAQEAMKGKRVKLPVIESDVVCELCGRKMVVKSSRYGKFLGCPGFPECKNIKPLPVEGYCPVCGKPMTELKSKNGKVFYGCTGFPECEFKSWDEPIAEQCPECSTPMFKKKGKGGRVYCAKEGCGYSRSLYARKTDLPAEPEDGMEDTPEVTASSAAKKTAKSSTAKKTTKKTAAKKTTPKTAVKKTAAKKTDGAAK